MRISRKSYRTLNALLYAVLFSALGGFSYLFLFDYNQLNSGAPNGMLTLGAVLVTIAAFNVFGFSMFKVNDWLTRNSPLFFAKKSRLVWNYIAIAIIILLLNYAVFVAVKWIMGVAMPYKIVGKGIKLIVVVWFVEMIIVGLLLVNHSIRITLKLYKEKQQLQQYATRAQYVALQNQLNPHFLFNSLNTLIAEIEYDPANAVQFTQNLSDVYRYILQCQDLLLVTLREELVFFNSYIFLHRVRLGECLKVENEIPDELLDRKVPPLTLQLLAENVIKHNYMGGSALVTITLSVDERAQMLSVTNDLRPKKSAIHSGKGLTNLAERYRLLCNKTIDVNYTDKQFVVSVPLLYE